jgi:hypothetical protein
MSESLVVMVALGVIAMAWGLPILTLMESMDRRTKGMEDFAIRRYLSLRDELDRANDKLEEVMDKLEEMAKKGTP